MIIISMENTLLGKGSINVGNFYNEVLNILKQDTRFFSKDGTFMRNAVYEAAMKMDERLIRLLLSNQETSNRFFVDVDGVKVFDKIGFAWVINNRQFLPDSYTRFKNKIGLADANGDLISTSSKVELVFPYKDCVLEGGQTKEDQKRQEIFYNEALTPDEIDRLLYPKVVCKALKYEHQCKVKHATSMNDSDNIIVKGNNLLVISSLLKKYEGKIKCIYIDPPYNTRSDANTFSYNNTFNHSTWLTFMKNRLEIARRLLSDDGIIYIDIDHYELFYLGVLADEIFGYNNRLGVLAVVHNLKGRYNEFFSIAHENKLVYAKNSKNAIIKNYADYNADNFPYEDKISKYKLAGLQRTGNGSLREERPNLFYPIFYNPKSEGISLRDDGLSVKILPIDSKGIERRWRWGKEKIKKEWKTEIIVKEVKGQYKLFTKIRLKGDRPKTLWNRPEYSSSTATNELTSLVSRNAFTYPKSVELVKDAIQIATDSDSMVLDFFGGSGTTGQAVLDLNKKDNGSRKFILVEQMDYIETATVPRLNAVIKKNGEGSFIYCELAKLNQNFVEEIQAATETTALQDIYRRMVKSGFISCKVDPADIDAAADDFMVLSLDDQKRFLMELLDKNLLYVNYCDMDDEEFHISDEDKAFTRSFYKEG